MPANHPPQRNPRILFENFNGDRFMAEGVEPYVSQAMDIIEAFDKAWFGEKPRNGFGSRSDRHSIATPPPLPANGRRSRRFLLHQQQQQPLPAPPDVVATTSTSPPGQLLDNNDTVATHQGLKSRFSWNNQSSSSTPIPANFTPEQQRQQQILQELPGIGTWAGRQRLFSVRPLPQVPNSQVDDDLLTLEATESSRSAGFTNFNGHGSHDHTTTTTSEEEQGLLLRNAGYDVEDTTLSDMMERRRRNGYTTTTKSSENGTEVLLNGNGGGGGDADTSEADDVALPLNATTPPVTHTSLQRTTSNTSSEARHISAAWKWRFTRRWEAEQRRVMETDPTVIAAEVDARDDLDALEYLQACGMGMDLQMLAGDVQQQQQRRRRKSGDRGRGRGGSSSRAGNTTPPPTGATNLNGNGLLSNRFDNGRIKSGIINAPEPSKFSNTAFSTALRRDASSVSTATMQFEVEPSYASVGDLLSCEGSENIGSYLMTPDTSGLGGNASNPAAATRDLLSVAVRGRELLQRQSELEREAAAKWEEIERTCCGGASMWAGNVVPPVDIAMHGKFYFVVLRMSEVGGGGGGGLSNNSSNYQVNGITSSEMNRSGSLGANRQRMLVRGRPKATPQELLEEAINEASTVCAQKKLPYVSISIVGAGEMEWREDTDRHLMVSPAPQYLNRQISKSVSSRIGGGGSGGSPPEVPCGDVCALTASLLHQALPLHFNISTRAQSLASHASGTLL